MGWTQLGRSASGGGISGSIWDSYTPSIAIDSHNKVYIAWTEKVSKGNSEIYLKVWDGKRWMQLGRSATGGGISKTTKSSLACGLVIDSENRVYVTWLEEVNKKNSEIHLRMWDGKEWVQLEGSATDGGISNTSRTPFYLLGKPDIAADDSGRIFITWMEEPGEIYLRAWQKLSSHDGKGRARVLPSGTGSNLPEPLPSSSLH